MAKTESNNHNKGLFDIFDEFHDKPDTKIFQLVLNGACYGANKKKPARISIQMPIDICNENNKNLGELQDLFMIVMVMDKQKVKDFLDK